MQEYWRDRSRRGTECTSAGGREHWGEGSEYRSEGGEQEGGGTGGRESTGAREYRRGYEGGSTGGREYRREEGVQEGGYGEKEESALVPLRILHHERVAVTHAAQAQLAW